MSPKSYHASFQTPLAAFSTLLRKFGLRIIQAVRKAIKLRVGLKKHLTNSLWISCDKRPTIQALRGETDAASLKSTCFSSPCAPRTPPFLREKCSKSLTVSPQPLRFVDQAVNQSGGERCKGSNLGRHEQNANMPCGLFLF